MAGRLRRAVERDAADAALPAAGLAGDGAFVGRRHCCAGRTIRTGLVMPGDFIPLAERTGLIGPISDWVIEEACRQSAEWRSTGLDLYVSVNLPAVFWQPTAMRQVLATIERFGLSADRMMVEITESTVMADALRSEPIIAELHERGLRLAIDDFGTGHSSLARLNQMLVTTSRSTGRSSPTCRATAARPCSSRPSSSSPTTSACTRWRRASRPRSSARFLVENGCPARARASCSPKPCLQTRSWRCTTPCATPPRLSFGDADHHHRCRARAGARGARPRARARGAGAVGRDRGRGGRRLPVRHVVPAPRRDRRDRRGGRAAAGCRSWCRGWMRPALDQATIAIDGGWAAAS